MTEHIDDLYLASHLEEKLATDERTHLLDVVVELQGSDVFIRGSVSCEQRRAMAERVVRELVPDRVRVINSLHIEHYGGATEVEALD